MNKAVLFAIVNPSEKTMALVPCHNLRPEATEVAKLEDKGLDFGVVGPQHSIVVHEFGLFVDSNEQSYFSLGRRLFAGNAVIFHEDETGTLVDVDPTFYKELQSKLRFYESGGDVEKAITADEIDQPSMSVGGEVIWCWPQPRPDLF